MATNQETDDMTVGITMHPDDAAIVRMLGALPYMLVEVGRGEDGGFELSIETGGGVPQEDEALDHLLNLMQIALERGEETARTAQ
ncbi:hypothetical protein [Ornithinimicrobium murale]|uniref:hypothetical protein n=1 Tax=Ornithinimicrobium murale TaxID=1050153 RepID=UPI0013B3943E|nr:hypothetical protein [Ornithinimicrobium murale]